MDKILAALVGFIVVIVLVAAFSLWATFLWFCFDNYLAAALGIPALATIKWYHMWAMTLFVMALFKGNCSK